MGLLDKIRGLWKKPVVVEDNPWAIEAQVEATVDVNPWKPQARPRFTEKPVRDDVWHSPNLGIKHRVLHTLSGLLILINIGMALLFYSNNFMLNVALFSYLILSTILLGHYFAITR